MSRYITGFSLSTNQAEEQQLKAKGFIKQEAKRDELGSVVNVWHKYNEQEDEPPMTKVQISYNDEMVKGLKKAGYTEGHTLVTSEGDVVLWTKCGTTPYDVPIVGEDFSLNPKDEVKLINMNLQRVYCNRLHIFDKYVKLWVRREKMTYIQDVKATSSIDENQDADLFNQGFIRIDKPTNTTSGGLRGTNFLWYRLTTDPSKSITDLKISTNQEERDEYKREGYTLVDVNLNTGKDGTEVYLWYKRREGEPVTNMTLFFDKESIPIYTSGGIQVIDKNINEGNEGDRFLCYCQL